MKECRRCGKLKDWNEFHKRTASPDGKQDSCKSCFRETNKLFREVRPGYQLNWQRQHPKQHQAIVSRFRKADKSGKIYYIKSPAGMFYIGMTNMYLEVRLIEHKAKYNRWIKGKTVSQHPALFQSFKEHGIENHEIGILLEFEGIDRKTLRHYEKVMIQSFMNLGIALNKQI